MSDACYDPIPLDELIAYHLGELAEHDEARVEDHYFGCAPCARRLATVADLGRAIVDLVRAGEISATVTRALVARGEASGLRIRSYHLAQGSRVPCTTAPDDDLVVTHLALDPEGADRVDLEISANDLEAGTTNRRTIDDVAVDAQHREVVFVLPARETRAFPRSVWTVHAVVRGRDGERRVGPYTLDHTPWEQLGEAER